MVIVLYKALMFVASAISTWKRGNTTLDIYVES